MKTERDSAAFYASLPTKRMASGVLLTDWDGRVLLVQPSYKPTWEIPGGVVELGESPRAAARREFREELGLDLTIGSLLVLDWMPAHDDHPDGVAMIYDGGTLDDADARRIHLAAGELNAYGFVDIESAVGLVSDSLDRRIRYALTARRLGHAIDLEDGRPAIARDIAPDQ